MSAKGIFVGSRCCPGDGSLNLEEFAKLANSPKLKSLCCSSLHLCLAFGAAPQQSKASASWKPQYYLLKSPKRIKNINPYVTLTRKNSFYFLGGS